VHAPDPFRRGRNTQNCTFAWLGPYPPGQNTQICIFAAANARIAASGCAWCGTNTAVVVTVIGGRCAVGTGAIASPGRVDSCYNGGGVFSLEARERCIDSRLFSRAMSACAVPAPFAPLALLWAALHSLAFPASTSCAYESALRQVVHR
jgi:hypothetical protein